MRELWIGALLMLASPASADTIYLKSGEVRWTMVERFSDGAFWVKDGKKTYIIQPDEIQKIVFSPDTRPIRPTAAPPVPARGEKPTAAGILSIPSASASSIPSPAADTRAAGDEGGSDPGLQIVDYKAQYSSGIFQVVGEIENRMDREARFVKVSVFLLDKEGAVSDQNFSFVHPEPPHVAPGDRKNFRVSFIHPPAGISKYKIRVESSQF